MLPLSSLINLGKSSLRRGSGETCQTKQLEIARGSNVSQGFPRVWVPVEDSHAGALCNFHSVFVNARNGRESCDETLQRPEAEQVVGLRNLLCYSCAHARSLYFFFTCAEPPSETVLMRSRGQRCRGVLSPRGKNGTWRGSGRTIF